MKAALVTDRGGFCRFRRQDGRGAITARLVRGLAGQRIGRLASYESRGEDSASGQTVVRDA